VHGYPRFHSTAHARRRRGAITPRLIYLYVKLFESRQGDPVFETFAIVSTIGFIIVFVALYQANRAASRSEENSGN
jgi:hypothetical protein